jgi:hypothetical protein
MVMLTPPLFFSGARTTSFERPSKSRSWRWQRVLPVFGRVRVDSGAYDFR